MIRDRKVETISTTVAEKTLCACDGRRIPSPRAHQERALGKGWVEDVSATSLDFTGQHGKAARGLNRPACILSA
jgi:hypothetical protein